MADIEKVIEGLELCGTGECLQCPYWNNENPYCGCEGKMHDDALELLKEQQETIKRLKDKLFAFPDAWIHCKDCKNGVKSSTFQYYQKLTWCNKHLTTHNDDWFCADGEMKE